MICFTHIHILKPSIADIHPGLITDFNEFLYDGSMRG